MPTLNALAVKYINLGLRRIALAPVRISLVLVIFTFFVCGGLFSIVESNADYVDGLYWVAVVMPTVGFGDFSPESMVGRFIYIWVVAVGMFATIVVGGAVAAAIVEHDLEDAHETAEVDDDLDKIKQDLTNALDRVKVICSTPRVKEALRLDHAEAKGKS